MPDHLITTLRSTIRGEVRFDAADLALYAADASNYRQVPIGVVLPRDADDVIAAVAVCRRHDVPLLARGGGTSQNGQCVNAAVVLDTSKYMDRVLAIDVNTRTARVEPGVVCDALLAATAAHGLTFAPDPATHSRCTIGGMIGNNSCGPHSVMAGKTVENVKTLEVLTYDGARFWVGATSETELTRIIAAGGQQGEIYAKLKALRDNYAELIRTRYPKLKRRVSGYNLDQLLPENGFNVARALVGTEGTCATVLQAELSLVRSPPCRVLLVIGFPDIYQAGDAVPELMRFGPIAVEGLDKEIVRGLERRGLRADEIALLPAGDAWMIVEFGGDTLTQASLQARAADSHFTDRAGCRTYLIENPALQARLWGLRETGASATALAIDGDTPDPVVGWEDAAVDPARLGDYLRQFQALVDRYGYRTSLYGHFADGCVHARINFNLRTSPGIDQWRRFLRDAAELVVQFGGSLSGEHGDGHAKAEFLPIMYGTELMQAMRDFKAIWDPRHKMNPGKVVDAYRVDQHLRHGPSYQPLQPATRLQFRSREGDGFTRQIERCIGMGKCRAHQGGTMCPSYRATRDERDSTRGRARLLSEMLQGQIITDRWADGAVRAALDTCLSCKACKSECPTHTDMASYKAEFLSHYYETHWRPRQAYSLGRIGRWAPWAARWPWLINAVTQTPGLSTAAKWIAGIAAERRITKFAPHPFHTRFERRPRTPENAAARTVLLWVDTFSNHFQPNVAHAAVNVLTAAGCRVTLPQRPLCCGRPLYDFGLLDHARTELGAILDALEPQIAAGMPIVGLEPGCLSVFKDELLKLFPDDTRAQRLAAQTFLFADYLEHIGYEPPTLAGTKVLLHGHCHQRAIFGMAAEIKLLERMQVDLQHLDAGCCGMAGAFGFDQRYYRLSQQVGEQELLPAIRNAPPDSIIVTNGFSCREQITQGTHRSALHLAELIDQTLQKKSAME
ncbi:MAG: FAD-binding oxidoreductase [Gammaproteobacteria bacterium]|nr:FAD-binding oxidoreductase [Gammaproteobacteria bacterium]